MIIELRHEAHGTHYAYSELEAENCEKNGWVRVVEKKEEAVAEKSLSERYKEKFGKPPHHRMKPETIKAALGEG